MIIIWLIITSTIITWAIDYRAHSEQQINTEIMNIIHCQIRPVKLFFMELSKIFRGLCPQKDKGTHSE